MKDGASFKYDDDLIITPDMKAVLNALPFYVLLVDERHYIRFANDAVSAKLGLDPGKITGEYCPSVVHGQNGPIPECPLEESRDTERPVEREVYDEKSGWLASSIYPTKLKTESGMRVFFHMVHDINKRKTAELKLKDSLVKLSKTIESSVRAISNIVEKRDPYTAGHQMRVGRIARLMARELGFDDRDSWRIRVSGLLHDVGKIVVPIEILRNPGKLNEHEYSIIKTHPAVGYEILKDIDFNWPAAETVFQHHERLNGSGYPNGLKGDEILFEARIIAVADILEAMTSDRPYRPAMSLRSTLDELLKNRDVLYDQRAVDACVKLYGNGKHKLQDLGGEL